MNTVAEHHVMITVTVTEHLHYCATTALTTFLCLITIHINYESQ